MEVLVLDGKNYVKASKAARDLGYASDYVGQLCRSGQVDSHLIGRTWYVNQDELGNHRFEKKRMSRVKAREQAKKAIEEHRLKVTGTPNNYRNIDIRYESDTEELIPETKRLEVQSVTVRRGRQKAEEAPYDSETIIENKGEKVRMSGDLKVVDVTDGPLETDTTVLKPGRIRSGTITVAPREETRSESIIAINAESQEEPTDPEEESVPEPKMSFADRIKLTEAPPSPDDATEAQEATELTTEPPTEEGTLLPSVLTLLLVVVLVLFTLPISKTLQYSAETGEILISYEFSLSEVISILQSKI